jgi:hypothetical protein
MCFGSGIAIHMNSALSSYMFRCMEFRSLRSLTR